MMIFGRSLFGGATSGQILATGFAAVLATAVAVPEITRHGAGNTQANATPVVQATKQQIPVTQALVGCLAQGSAQCDFSGYVSAEGIAQGIAKPSVEFFPAGHGDALFSYSGLASKRTRVKQTLMWAYASAEGEGQIYEYAQTEPVRARAYAFGTTYHVGRTDGRANAFGQAKCVLIAGGRAQAHTSSQAEGECRRSGGAGSNALAEAGHLVDASVTRGGVREFELMGAAVSASSAWISNTQVYQIQSVSSHAEAGSAKAVHTKGARGSAQVTAKGRGIAMGTQTGVTGVGGGKTTAHALSEYRCALKGNSVSYATGGGYAQGRYNRSGAVNAYPTMQVSTVQLGIQGSTALTEAVLFAVPTKTQFASSTSEGTCTATGFIQVNDIAKAPTDRTVVLLEEVRLVAVPEQPRLIKV